MTLEPVEQDFSNIPERPPNFDVTLNAWAADWPSIGTVIPPLYDSRVNDPHWGTYENAEVDAMIDEAALIADVDEQAAKYLEIDDRLGEDVAYIPLNIARFFLRGSKVTGYVNNPAAGGFPDLGRTGVEN